MEAIRLWSLLALVLAALLVVAAVSGTEFHEEEDEEEGLDREAAEDLEWSGSSGSSRMLLAGKLEPPPKCYRSNCAKNDTNVEVCKKKARDQKSRSIQCCKYNPKTGFSGPIPFFQTSACVDLSSEAKYCGSCTTVCPAGQICCRGACIDTCCQGACPAGLTCCGNKCVDVNTDAAHCSGCGLACLVDQPTCCGGACKNLFADDEMNCGECFHLCQDRCCNGICKYTFTDPDSCGSCGLPCPPDLRVCCAGECFNSSPGFSCVG